MQRIRALLGLFAAIILVIGGPPASASATACDPCPPNCRMMASMAQAAGDPHAQTPERSGQPPGKTGNVENPCKSNAACQSAFVAPLLLQASVETVWLAEAAEHDRPGVIAAPSRPPDPTLRPPIQL